jgi:predicted amidophosphoribosyltransferase
VFRAVAEKLKEELAPPFDIVAIPNSTATIKDKADCRIFEQARAVASAAGNGVRAIPALRWKRERTPTHKGGGSRDPQEHFENLEVVEKPTQPCVLFDDVLTSGSQMIGASRRLKTSGIVPVVGIVVGRAVKEQKSPVIGWYEEVVETESEPLDWLR